MLKPILCVLAALTVAVAAPAAASPADATGSFTTTLSVDPTTIETSIGAVTVSGSVTAEVTQFRVDESGRLVAVATLSGSVSATTARGTVTVDFDRARVVLRASLQANCSGQLNINFNAVAQVNATVTVTNAGGRVLETFQISETFPLHGSLSFTAQTEEQRALICEISQLLQTHASAKALVDKLNTLLTTL